MILTHYIVAQNQINPFTGLGELGSELNDLRSLVVFVVLMFGIGMIYLLIERSRAKRDREIQTTRRVEIETQGKIDSLQAQENSAVVTTLRDMFTEMVKANREQAESQRMVAAAIERSSNVGLANSQAITSNTEATFTVNETMKTLPAAMSAIVESAASRNLANYSAQMTGLGSSLQQIDAGIQDINKSLKSKYWMNSTDAVKIMTGVEKIAKEVKLLLAKTTGEMPVIMQTDTVELKTEITTIDTKEGD